MTYIVYAGLPGTEQLLDAQKDRWLHRKEFNDELDALGYANLVNVSGVEVALLIEGSDGTRLTKDIIPHIIKSRAHELVGRPKVW